MTFVHTFKHLILIPCQRFVLPTQHFPRKPCQILLGYSAKSSTIILRIHILRQKACCAIGMSMTCQCIELEVTIRQMGSDSRGAQCWQHHYCSELSPCNPLKVVLKYVSNTLSATF